MPPQLARGAEGPQQAEGSVYSGGRVTVCRGGRVRGVLDSACEGVRLRLTARPRAGLAERNTAGAAGVILNVLVF